MFIHKKPTNRRRKETNSKYIVSNIFGTLEVQRRVKIYMARMLEIWEDLLEKISLPVGSFTGPVSTATL